MKDWIYNVLKFVPDKQYIELMYYYHFGYKLDLKNPKTFNEKLQWLKLNDRNPYYSLMVDKIAVKEYVANKIGKQYVVPLLGVWDDPDDIDVEDLPKKFVLKCNHDSKSVFICTNKEDFNIDAVKKKLKACLKRNGYYYGREWPYKNVKPRVLAEEYIESDDNCALVDYKVVCFNGKAEYIQVHQGRGTENYTQDFYTKEWKKTLIVQGPPISNVCLEEPVFLREMLDLSEILAENIATVRIDWYYASGKLLFGEITFYDGSGLVKFDNISDDITFGDKISLKGI